MTETKISIKNLYKIFGANPTGVVEEVKSGMTKQELLDQHNHILGLENINLDMAAHKIQVVMGLSGSGKSTLIRHINRLIDPTVGSIEVDGQDVMLMNEAELRDFRRHKVSMVFQKFALLPHRTVLENVAYGLDIQGVDSRKKAMHWIERVGLSGYEENYPGHLSGGMQQRVGLARALATDADILLMDEAFSALDPLIRADMQDTILELQQELKKTIVFITHDLDEALKVGDRIAILRDGKIVQDDDPQQILMNPADDYIEDFVKDVNRARVLTVNSVMQKPDENGDGPQISSSAILEDAACLFQEEGCQVSLQVVNEDAEVVGSITPLDVMNHLVRPDVSSKAAQ